MNFTIIVSLGLWLFVKVQMVRVFNQEKRWPNTLRAVFAATAGSLILLFATAVFCGYRVDPVTSQLEIVPMTLRRLVFPPVMFSLIVLLEAGIFLLLTRKTIAKIDNPISCSFIANFLAILVVFFGIIFLEI